MKDSSRIYHKVVEEILKLVDSDSFSVGCRLPSERELALKFGVSRACVREAQVVLEAQGRLTVKPGSGAYIFSENDTRTNKLPSPKCFELVEAHGLFEAEVAALAAPLITDEIIKELERLASIIVGKVKTEMYPDEAIVAFYNLIARATNNHAIVLMIESMWKMKPSDKYAQGFHQRVYNQRSSGLEDEYQAILDALKKRQSVQARRAVQEHFSYMMKALIKASEFDAYQEMQRKISKTRTRFLLSSQLN